MEPLPSLQLIQLQRITITVCPYAIASVVIAYASSSTWIWPALLAAGVVVSIGTLLLHGQLYATGTTLDPTRTTALQLVSDSLHAFTFMLTLHHMGMHALGITALSTTLHAFETLLQLSPRQTNKLKGFAVLVLPVMILFLYVTLRCIEGIAVWVGLATHLALPLGFALLTLMNSCHLTLPDPDNASFLFTTLLLTFVGITFGTCVGALICHYLPASTGAATLLAIKLSLLFTAPGLYVTGRGIHWMRTALSSARPHAPHPSH